MESSLQVEVVGGARLPWESGRSPLQLKLGAKSGSRRSPDGAYRQLKLATKPGSRRSLGRVLLVVEVVGGARLP